MFPENTALHKSPANLRYRQHSDVNQKEKMIEEDASSVELDSDDSCFDDTPIETIKMPTIVKQKIDFSISDNARVMTIEPDRLQDSMRLNTLNT